MTNQYEGTKVTDIEVITKDVPLDRCKLLIVSEEREYLISMKDLISYIKAKIK